MASDGRGAVATPPAAAAPAAGDAITARQWLILLSVQFTTILFGLTATSVTVILPQLKGAFSATQDQISWVLTFNLVATAVATPLTGWLAARLGWRTLMICSVTGFTVASMLCGMTSSLDTLLFLRVVQGAFGAPIFPMGQTVLLASFERRQHPFIIMMWGVGGVMGPILGPTFGGVVTDLLGWRWTFLLILPLGVASAALVMAALNDQERGTARRFDLTGYMFLGVAIAATQLMFDRGQREDWFDSPEIVIECALAAVFLAMFVIHMNTARDPLFEAGVFADRNFAVGTAVALVMGMLQYTTMVLFPPLLQELRGYPETIIGYLLATRGLGNLMSFLIVAQLTRHAPRACLCAGLLIQAGAGWWMCALDINMTTADVLWTNMLHGFGFGLAYTPMAVLAFSTMPVKQLTQGNSVFALIRMLGGSFYISMTLLVLVHTTAAAGVNLSTTVTVFSAEAVAPWTAAYGAFGGTAPYERMAAELHRQASMIGYINAFALMTIVPVVAAPLAFLFARRRAGA
ncbi:MAG: DHA2 family efflux MFS transporter permease subunit [Rhodospirillales bacterium]|nr:MAG: DHA2 family efflux MFS transporter permease subunit [Rhodospirillales bacterium]